ncbi:hypothetical protein GCM10027184_52530 [Saccharothrix stipae]
MKDAGFKGAILTAKHHDGFLLFPSNYSRFGVTSSSWAGGRGDVLESFTDSMHKYGLKVGFYVSSADMRENQPGGKFANGSPSRPVNIPSHPADVVDGVTFQFNSDDYNTYFENTLYELLTRYGPVTEIWLDGANPTGRNQPYNFADWTAMARKLQPTAVLEGDGGPDVRWIGNEDGYARTSEWSVVPTNGNIADVADTALPAPGFNTAPDVASDAVLSRRNSNGTSAWNVLRWPPGECNGTLSARHNWFWQPGDSWRPLPELLNISPNRQGLLDQSVVTALGEFGSTLSKTFGTNLASGATVANDEGTSNTTGHTPELTLDGNLDSSWQPNADTGSLVFTLPATKTFDVISVQEDLNIGQRVRSIAVDSWNGSSWTQIANEPVVGHKRLIRLAAPVSTSRLRLRITGSRAVPAIAEFSLHLRPGSVGGGTTSTIVGGQSGRCIDGGAAANGTRAQLSDCTGGTNLRWTYTANKQLTVGGKCLDAYARGTTNGTAVVTWDCNGGNNQQWSLRSWPASSIPHRRSTHS